VVKKITVDLSAKSIDSAIKEVRKYKAWVLEKEKELRLRLATLGASVASIRFSTAIYNGTNDVTVRVEDDGSMATIYAEGESVAFIEFGAGAKHGYGHPQAGEFGVGPGTYPDGKGNWDNPKGWYIPGGEHTYGNPPAMAMYSAVQTITEQVTMIAKEVFSK
jgi:hypothetical protein